jgi:hypothetical protein
LQQLVRELSPREHLDIRVSYTAQSLWNALVELAGCARASTMLKANMLPSKVAAFCLQADHMLPAPALQAHAGVGIVIGSWPDGLTKDHAASILTAWRQSATIVVQRCPVDWKPALNVWGPPPADAWLMREVKAKFDPRGVFNPGRFVDGI